MDKKTAGLTIENAFSGLALGPSFEEAIELLLKECPNNTKKVLKLRALAEKSFTMQRSARVSDSKVDKISAECYDLLYELDIEGFV